MGFGELRATADTDSGGIYFCVDRAGETVWWVAQPEGEGVHMYSLSDEDCAEAALALETSPDQRTKMVHARCLQRHGALRAGETLLAAWNSSLEALRARTEPFLAPPVEVPLAGKGPGRGRGIRRGR